MDLSTEESQPVSKRMRKVNEADEPMDDEMAISKDDDNNHNAVKEDASQVTSENAIVPATNINADPPVASSPTPAEAPESAQNNKPQKARKKMNFFLMMMIKRLPRRERRVLLDQISSVKYVGGITLLPTTSTSM